MVSSAHENVLLAFILSFLKRGKRLAGHQLRLLTFPMDVKFSCRGASADLESEAIHTGVQLFRAFTGDQNDSSYLVYLLHGLDPDPVFGFLQDDFFLHALHQRVSLIAFFNPLWQQTGLVTN